MNAVLQIIAALYVDEAQNRCLEGWINKINDTHHALDPSDINKFIEGLPEAAKSMATSGRQHDPDEFIEHIKEHFLCLSDGYIIYPIICTESLFLKVKHKQEHKECICKYKRKSSASHMLTIPIVQGCNLNQMIKHYQEQFVRGEEGVDIDWKKISLCEEKSLPLFVDKNQNEIDPVMYGSNKGFKKDYIKQTILNLSDRLYIKLDRNPNQSKISDSVREAMHIKIQSDPNQDATVSFDLNGFIVHRGDGTTDGHYVAYVKRKGKWYKADDSVITEISLEEATDKSKTAYLLFYTKS
ncbi:ubiquitin carboxyl-terminal hydrolase family protein [Cardinium endosymbiont of Dermatophagoides farinae]|uniref:ubiquitin carboxyl-terminal hydrolase family protein n=1 Tax=Cardinium endosymbiont of Dermatophagoides farinae TaxID=2597823 RepID=UPI00118285AD|nr:ubiquitin carboxyl-terminal hydrolase family protein [Cardinium endosymbiont of Dermatophagoides farinae]TSJ80598.1 hypothetical protein FPG78_00690 [Cardinium endosymbiont of Dermatophagoides farinae]